MSRTILPREQSISFTVVGEALLRRIESQDSAGSGRDVAEVRKTCREMSVFDWGGELGAVANGGDEVGGVGRRSVLLFSCLIRRCFTS